MASVVQRDPSVDRRRAAGVGQEIAIVLTDDWELRGNGSGDVETLQVRPAKRLMDLYEDLGVRSSFHVEVMQQLAFEEYASRYPHLARQRDLWTQAVESMLRRGFDVQLHLHPQWLGATYDGTWWKLGGTWHIADYSRQQIQDMIGRAVEYLNGIIKPARVVAFRGGSWGMGPPSRDVFETLVAHGIRIDVSITNGLYYNTAAIRLDYRNVDCPYVAYYPDVDDIRRKSDRDHGLIEIPTQSVPRSRTLSTLLNAQVAPRRACEKGAEAVRRLLSRQRTPAHVVRNAFDLAGEGREDHILDFSAGYSSAGFIRLTDICMRRALQNPTSPLRVLVFENHTKDLRKGWHFRRVADTVRHIRRRYPDVQFLTMPQVWARASELV